MGGSGRVKMVKWWRHGDGGMWTEREKMVVWVRAQMVRAHGPKDI